MPGLIDLHAHYAVDLFGEGRVDEYTVNPLCFSPWCDIDFSSRRGRSQWNDGGSQTHRSWRTDWISNSEFRTLFRYGAPGWCEQCRDHDQVRADVRTWAAQGARGFKAKGFVRIISQR
jgi:hypothetical protein